MNKINFATQWHLKDKWFCRGGSGILLKFVMTYKELTQLRAECPCC
jgi:hypothetical protein